MRIPKWLEPPLDFVKQLLKEFNEDNSAMVAAAVSFFIFLSLIPLLLLAVAAFGFVLQSQEQAYQAVLRFLRTAVAEQGLSNAIPLIEGVIRGSSAATGFGIIALLWAGSQAFVNLEIAVNISWNTPSRGFLKGRLVAIGLLLAVGALLMLSFAVTAAATAIQAHNITILGRNVSQVFGHAWNIFAYFLPLALSVATFTLIYKILPNTYVPNVPALVGGIVAGVLWEGAKYAFSWYVAGLSNYDAIYGSLASIILLLLWIYYSSIVTILGAQIASLYNRRDLERELRK